MANIVFRPSTATSPPQEVDYAHGLPVTLLDASGNVIFPAASAMADGTTNPTLTQLASYSELFNNTGWDRERSNTEGTLLVSAARTTDTASATMTNYNGRGVMLFLRITAIPGAPAGLSITVQAIDPVSGLPDSLFSFSSAKSAIGLYTYVMYPGAAAAPSWGITNQVLPRTWRAYIYHNGDSGSYTYSLGYSVIVR